MTSRNFVTLFLLVVASVFTLVNDAQARGRKHRGSCCNGTMTSGKGVWTGGKCDAKATFIGNGKAEGHVMGNAYLADGFNNGYVGDYRIAGGFIVGNGAAPDGGVTGSNLTADGSESHGVVPGHATNNGMIAGGRANNGIVPGTEMGNGLTADSTSSHGFSSGSFAGNGIIGGNGIAPGGGRGSGASGFAADEMRGVFIDDGFAPSDSSVNNSYVPCCPEITEGQSTHGFAGGISSTGFKGNGWSGGGFRANRCCQPCTPRGTPQCKGGLSSGG